jgi:hypothetical protein
MAGREAKEGYASGKSRGTAVTAKCRAVGYTARMALAEMPVASKLGGTWARHVLKPLNVTCPNGTGSEGVT